MDDLEKGMASITTSIKSSSFETFYSYSQRSQPNQQWWELLEEEKSLPYIILSLTKLPAVQKQKRDNKYENAKYIYKKKLKEIMRSSYNWYFLHYFPNSKVLNKNVNCGK